MYRFVKVMKETELPVGKSAIVSAGEEEIALFNYKGEYYAITNKCPHRGAPLGEGRIEEGIVICPNHEWRYELATGNNMQNPELKIKSYPVRIKNEYIYIGLEKEGEIKALGKSSSTLPADLKFDVPIIQKPINPDEEL